MNNQCQRTLFYNFSSLLDLPITLKISQQFHKLVCRRQVQGYKSSTFIVVIRNFNLCRFIRLELKPE